MWVASWVGSTTTSSCDPVPGAAPNAANIPASVSDVRVRRCGAGRWATCGCPTLDGEPQAVDPAGPGGAEAGEDRLRCLQVERAALVVGSPASVHTRTLPLRPRQNAADVTPVLGVPRVAVGHGGGMSNQSAAQAREGLLDSIAGKTKEVAGALTGNDDLVEEGHLQQAEADRRKQAVADDAIAEAERQDATEQVRQAELEASRSEAAAQAEADRREQAAEQQRAAQHVVAERDAAGQEAAGQQAAEEQADRVAEQRFREAEHLSADASATERQAAAEAARLRREADEADHRAQQIRSEIEK